MEFSLEIKRPTVNFGFHCLSTLDKDRQPQELITFQSTFLKNNQEEIRMTKASEAIVFEKLPLIRVLFDSKLNGTLKDDKDQICYDPEHTKTERAALPRIPGKIVYIYNLIQSSFKNRGREHEKIAKWNVGTLWTMIDCLVRFLDGKPLPLDSKMGLMEKHWDLELIGIKVLAIYLGCTEINDKAVRNELISYMRRLPIPGFTNSSISLEKTSETMNHAKMFDGKNYRQAEIIDLTAEDQIGAPKTLKKKMQSTPKSQKLNTGPLSSVSKNLEIESPQASTIKNSVQAAPSKLNLQKLKKANLPAATLRKSENPIKPNSTAQRQKKSTRPCPAQQKLNQ
ncbi:uncharacterized protein EAE97_005556 [Botrytis byssoidea]|uniref:Uncharacterized protein n=1 Tax=Botrytis byssoidea TaxID=139641 RepID=A0A9P5IN05_9HELO|nr:uncharacterized protein EAE97_005556 [Botrytis byssoidea]KAF7944923.1 hypothetical protein EAE97_005556 [Botrytis byssoidea]